MSDVIRTKDLIYETYEIFRQKQEKELRNELKDHARVLCRDYQRKISEGKFDEAIRISISMKSIIPDNQQVSRVCLEDVENIFQIFLSVIKNALSKGQEIKVRDWFMISSKYRKRRTTKHPISGEEIEISAHLIPYISFGKQIRQAVSQYEATLSNLEEIGQNQIQDEMTFEEYYKELTGELFEEE